MITARLQTASTSSRIWVETVGRLVQNQYFGVVQHCLGEAYPTFEALGQRLDRLWQHMSEVQPLDDVIEPIATVFAVETADPRNKLEKPAHAHFAVAGSALREVSDPFLGRQRVAGNVVAANRGGATGWRDKAGQHLHRRRFAGAVRAEEAEYLAGFDGKTQVIYGSKVAIAFGQIVGLDHWVNHRNCEDGRSCGQMATDARWRRSVLITLRRNFKTCRPTHWPGCPSWKTGP